jgi:nicotinamidase/pyrazinamidase
MDKIFENVGQGDALIIVDVQIDFCPGGALPIEGGDKVIPILNQWIAVTQKKGVLIYASRDWHPIGHISFQERGGLWPVHCIQDSEGACFHPDLNLPEDTLKVTKGVRFDKDQNSVFDQTGLAKELWNRKVKRLFVGGLAEDVCVLATVLDARKEGFEVTLISDGTRPVKLRKGEEAKIKMSESGARFV